MSREPNFGMNLRLTFIASSLLVSCSMPGPLAPGAAASMEIPARYDASQPPVPEIRANLLRLFNDRALSQTVARALGNNPDLRASFARFEEAGFSARSAAAPLYPTLNAATGGGRRAGVLVPATNFVQAQLDSRWELDVWGRIRAGVTAACADQAAAAADYESARQSIAAQTMLAWFDLVAAQQLVELSQRRLRSFESSQQMISRRFDLGTSSLAELELSKADTENTRADLQRRIDQRDQASRLVRVLAGDIPDSRLRSDSWPSLQRSVAAGIPSDLLLNRPDIDAAYQRIRAADARVKVSHADLFPSFALTGSGGRIGTRLGDLGNSAFNSWNLLADISAPIFDGGQRQANLGAAGKRAEQAYQSYRSTVLNALREVEDALGSESLLKREQSARLHALTAARKSEARTRRDYEAGLTEVLNLLVAQRLVFNTEEQTINIHATRLKNRVRLALALGKGV